MKGTFLLTASTSALAGIVFSSYIYRSSDIHLRFAVVVVLIGAAAVGMVRLVRSLDRR